MVGGSTARKRSPVRKSLHAPSYKMTRCLWLCNSHFSSILLPLISSPKSNLTASLMDWCVISMVIPKVWLISSLWSTKTTLSMWWFPVLLIYRRLRQEESSINTQEGVDTTTWWSCCHCRMVSSISSPSKTTRSSSKVTKTHMCLNLLKTCSWSLILSSRRWKSSGKWTLTSFW